VVIGEAGFGAAPGPNGIVDMPQLGRVILQDGVTVGANTTIDRGAYDDTVVGENTKIDNLVQIGHNTVIGRNCVIAGQTGISGSVTVGDGVRMGGGVGIADHLTIGDGAELAARSGHMQDVPAGGRYVGAPAVPVRQFFREVTALRRLAEGRGRKGQGDGGKDG
jgi:UDP-3-O-[3-hydroxymyristoyl] glucosamine N-acyltransferase